METSSEFLFDRSDQRAILGLVMMTVGHLMRYLEDEQQKGLRHVALDPEARQAIRAAVKHHQAALASAAASPPASDQAQTSARPQAPPTPSQAAQHLAEPAPTPVPPEHVKINIPSGTRAEQLAALAQQTQRWLPAQSLGTLRNRAVFSVGSPESPVVFVGEAPGYEEELQNEPFVGKAGQKFNQILKAMGLSRKEVYLTNACKYRPAVPGQTTNNRKPSAAEIAACLPLLQKELEIVQPRCVIALGATAAEALLGKPVPLAQLREAWHSCHGELALRVTYHPSYLLRNEDRPHEKRKVWEDMLAVMEHLSLPISQKQRSYFTSP